LTYNETLEEIKAFYKKWNMASKILIEKSANGDALAETLGLDSDISVEIELVKVNKAKTARLEEVSPLFAQHLVYVPNPTMVGYDWARTVIDEIVYLGLGNHDDTADAFTQALRYLQIQPSAVDIYMQANKNAEAFRAALSAA
jgi:predicted phage terminase large subunit-like protein